MRGKIRALGNVNVGAIEEYKEVKERYDFMKAQVTDVEKSRAIGSLETSGPVYFRNQPVGCTATIITQMYDENGMEIPPQIAGLLLAAILSDTLVFRSPTCTPLDEALAKRLAKIAGVDIDEFASEMFEVYKSI